MDRLTSAVVGHSEAGAHRFVEESVSYAVGHQVRVEILAALHEGPASAPALAKLLNRPRTSLTHHLEELVKSCSIEIAFREKVGNILQNFYRVVELPFFDEEAWQKLSPQERQVTSALILQAAFAEALASLWAGKFHTDLGVVVSWNRIVLDAQGRQELSVEQDTSWQRMKDIEAEAANRRAESGEEGTMYVVTSLGYERGRNAPPTPRSLEAGICEGMVFGTADDRGRSVEEAVSHSIGHRMRIEVQAALHEGPATASELAKILHQPLSLLTYHIDELLKAGLIAVAYTQTVGSIEQNVYCAVKLPYFSEEDWKNMTPQERQVTSAVILQAAIAEALASLWAGKFHRDPQVTVAWNRIRLDDIGRKALTQEQVSSWARMGSIAREAERRLEDSEDVGTLYVITSLGFERSRTSAPVALRSPENSTEPEKSPEQ
jgi:DNA-binding transcriptional ArsR family regulator